ncbi:MAG: ornithine carbamoyltransferase [bacterium]
MKHLLSIESLTAQDIETILQDTATMKSTRGQHAEHPLRHQCWALMFSKSSTRTRVSFEVGIRELGGDALFLAAADIQLGRGEPIRDTARVMRRMLHGAVIRTFAQKDVEDFAAFSGIPTINALTDEEHPCQILADLFSIRESRGSLQGLRVAFIGDGDCNVARSWIWAAARCGFELVIATPSKFQPPSELLERAGGNVRITTDPRDAAAGAHVLYTDVWVSMGKEEEAAYRLAQFQGYQINAELVVLASPGAMVMHCLPAYRGKEIDEATLETHATTIFRQAENRLHAQKAIMARLVKNSKEIAEN